MYLFYTSRNANCMCAYDMDTVIKFLILTLFLLYLGNELAGRNNGTGVHNGSTLPHALLSMY